MKNQTTGASDRQVISTPSVSTPSYSPPDTSSMLMQVSGALTLIILIILCIAWLAKRCGLVTKHTVVKGIKIDASLNLGGRERLIIVEVENRRLLLGVTSHHITCLHTLSSASDGATNASDTHVKNISSSIKSVTDFTGLFKKLLNKKLSAQRSPAQQSPAQQPADTHQGGE